MKTLVRIAVLALVVGWMPSLAVAEKKPKEEKPKAWTTEDRLNNLEGLPSLGVVTGEVRKDIEALGVIMGDDPPSSSQDSNKPQESKNTEPKPETDSKPTPGADTGKTSPSPVQKVAPRDTPGPKERGGDREGRADDCRGLTDRTTYWG
jgi:hypothetical protein